MACTRKFDSQEQKVNYDQKDFNKVCDLEIVLFEDLKYMYSILIQDANIR